MLDTKVMWKHTWPSSVILCEFIAENASLWKGSSTLELGAGAGALPSVTAIKCGGAKNVWISDQGGLGQAFDYMRENVDQNLSDEERLNTQINITELDWNDEDTIKKCLNEITSLDFIFGSDVFFDPSVFESLVRLLRQFFNAFPYAEFYFAYQIRDSDWCIEHLLLLNCLQCVPIRLVDTDKHSIYIGKIYPKGNELEMSSRTVVFAGVEGGATRSALILFDSDGKVLLEKKGSGMNCLLLGIENTVDQIAKWIRESVKEYRYNNPLCDVHLPIAALGMGLSGAEDDETIRRMLEYCGRQHMDVAKYFHLTSDSVCAAATAFDNGGVVLIAGTGSTCRLIKTDGSIHSAGGWGHIIGDGGSGFWIAIRAIRTVFDVDDGMKEVNFDISTVKTALLSHFNIINKLQLLDIMYGERFDKSRVASFCNTLSEVARNGDPFATQVFHDAGFVLAQHLCAVSRHFDADMFSKTQVVFIGSVFKSWDLLKKGFCERLSAAPRRFVKMELFKLKGSAAIGAALLAAKHARKDDADNVNVLKLYETLQCRVLFDELDL